MKFKIADDPKFNERWQALMRANENLLSILHETLSTPEDIDRLSVLSNNIRDRLNWLVDLKPVQARVSVHMNRHGSFESIASDLKVQTNMTGPDDDGWVKYVLTAPRENIVNLASQFKVGVKWEE